MKMITLFIFYALCVFKTQGQQKYELLRTIGQYGSQNGNFLQPEGIAVDAQNNLYVADALNKCIQKFDSAGNFLLKWGTSGTGNGQFNGPYDIAIDADGYVYVADFQNYNIQKFTSNGTFVLKWGSAGSAPLFTGNPLAITESNGFVYVLTSSTVMVIYKFTNTGIYQSRWSTQLNDGNLQTSSMESDHQGNICVAIWDTLIRKYTVNGAIADEWGANHGTGPGEITRVWGMSYDSNNNCYVTECDQHNNGTFRFQQFDANGNFVREAGFVCLGVYNLYSSNIALSSNGRVYISDECSSCIHVYHLVGQPTGLTNNQLRENKINLFPNPSNEELFLNVTDNSGFVNVIVYSSTGSIVYENNQVPSNENFKLDAITAPGVYFIKITCSSGTVTKKLVKI